MTDRYENIIIHVISTLAIPFVLVFGFYVVIHGHYAAGGGFQGGALLAVGIILLRLYLGKEAAYKLYSPKAAMLMAAGGMLLYMVTGLLPLLQGGSFLDLGLLIPGITGAEMRFQGILVVEIAIGLAVWGTLVLLFDVLAGGMR